MSDLRTELSAALGYMRNARIDLETGATKATAIRTISGGISRAEAALSAPAPQGIGRDAIKRGLVNSAGQLAAIVHGEPDAAEAAMDVVADRILTLLEPRP